MKTEFSRNQNCKK